VIKWGVEEDGKLAERNPALGSSGLARDATFSMCQYI
jgi:hypothetical protein